MCGIVGAASHRNIVPVLVQGLQRLEYRGYDSCGVAVHAGGLTRARTTSRVADLVTQVRDDKVEGLTGIAHTRWATHGAPAVHNAHPHFSHGPGADAQGARPGRIALVHNGIIENHEALRAALEAKGYVFESQTDTEVIAHLVDSLYDGDLFEAVKAAVLQLHGAYAIAVICRDEPQRVVGARAGSPLILGAGKDGSENFLASDAMALAGVTDQIVYLEEGDVVDLQPGKYWIVDKNHKPVTRQVRTVLAHSGAAELGPYRHYMQKEIFEQPRAIGDTLEGVAGIVPELFDGIGQDGATGQRAPRVQGHRQDPHPRLRHQLLQRLHRQVLAREASRRSPRRSRSRASTATATRCPTRRRWWSPSASRAKRPTRSPRSSTPARSAWNRR
jgi:glucosamine--fructose-6-phosphate aminotransferase (isomerizing)